MEKYSLDQIKDEFIVQVGTLQRTLYDQELQMEILGGLIKKVRLERNMTQEELGKLIGVQRAQISKLENNTTNVTVDTILRVFSASKAKVNFNVELLNSNVKIAW
ncbi:helix-turn-helix domain-containing protein [Belliella sp. R4-6]|uniref:Helix-turn-helix domain-containing protein n=1 Tax=Belliella alkalica TaxID=1730871 RepID=A0ABS9VGF2_9BACT|nr:helix-turn-helix transcriptional regulator [Belliella alkalica]MCH7415030.1 helix-turn-helix domain-containing protein [Belliella alkalica]